MGDRCAPIPPPARHEGRTPEETRRRSGDHGRRTVRARLPRARNGGGCDSRPLASPQGAVGGRSCSSGMRTSCATHGSPRAERCGQSERPWHGLKKKQQAWNVRRKWCLPPSSGCRRGPGRDERPPPVAKASRVVQVRRSDNLRSALWACGDQRRRWMTMAIPWPPPTHIDSTPNSLSESSRPLSRVVMMRAPVMPNG